MLSELSLTAYELVTILGCALVTWLSRVLPFVLLKWFKLPKPVIEYLQFVPIVIMSALWFSSLFTQHLGSLPSLNLAQALASVPTVGAAVLSRNLFITVVVGVVCLALAQLVV